MPKMFIHTPEGTFDFAARTLVASELTDLGLRCEAIPATAIVRSTVWIYFSDYPAKWCSAAASRLRPRS